MNRVSFSKMKVGSYQKSSKSPIGKKRIKGSQIDNHPNFLNSIHLSSEELQMLIQDFF